MSKIGPHVINPTAQSDAWSKVAPIVKALDNPAPLTIARPDAIRVYRAYFPDQSPAANPYTVRDRILNGLKGYRHPNLYVEIFNEVSPMAAYVPLFRAVVRLLHDAGVKVCGPCFSTGAYSGDDWALARGCGWDAIAIHGYWGTQGFTEWNSLMPRVLQCQRTTAFHIDLGHLNIGILRLPLILF